MSCRRPGRIPVGDPSGEPGGHKLAACWPARSAARRTLRGFKFCGECAAPLERAPAREQRKTVTVLFCDVTGSTALGERLDPETLRGADGALLRAMRGDRRAPRRHGREVHRRRGDGRVRRAGRCTRTTRCARCGPRSRCATRFPRARRRRARIGVNTGEVVTGTEERLATGDAVNVAARLEQAAAPGEILLGAETSALVRDAVEVERGRAARAEGQGGARSRRTGSLSVATAAPPAPPRRAMVGRERELRPPARRARPGAAEGPASCSPSSAPPGSASRASSTSSSTASTATVVRGRASPTARASPTGRSSRCSSSCSARSRAAPGRARPRSSASLARRRARRRQLVASVEEIAWAVRRLLEASPPRPLVVVFDDLQWGEEVFLDLVEHVADLSRDAPILLLCMARPELLDRRPAGAAAS